MSEKQIFALLGEFWRDMQQPDFYWEVLALALILAASWWLSLRLRRRESLNGTFYTRRGQRSPLEHGISVRLQAGDILWLYDLPLKVEQCNDEKNGVDGIA